MDILTKEYTSDAECPYCGEIGVVQSDYLFDVVHSRCKKCNMEFPYFFGNDGFATRMSDIVYFERCCKVCSCIVSIEEVPVADAPERVRLLQEQEIGYWIQGQSVHMNTGCCAYHAFKFNH